MNYEPQLTRREFDLLLFLAGDPGQVFSRNQPMDTARQYSFQSFDRRGSQSSRTRAGAGLGLAIARAIVEAHGGRIWLEPPPPTRAPACA